MSAFDTAVANVKNLNGTPSDDEKLEIYGLYKQALNGDNTASAPWAIQVTEKAKWSAWEALKGTSSDDAKARYVSLVEALIATYGIKA